MCSIGGAIFRNPDGAQVDGKFSPIVEMFRRGSDRGRDWWGYAAVGADGHLPFTSFGKGNVDDYHDLKFHVPDRCTQIMYHCRAVPVTEYSDHRVADARSVSQPVTSSSGWVVAHNGLIANDAQLAKTFGLEHIVCGPDYFDSKLLPSILDWVVGSHILEATHYLHTSLGALGKKLALFFRDNIKGSFAIAAANSHNPNVLILASNYKPIYYWISAEGDFMYASQAGYMEEVSGPTSGIPQKLPPYTMALVTVFEGQLNVDLYTLRPERNNKALIVFSGGLDSTVVAAWAKREGYSPTLLHYKYGCKATEMEDEAVRNVAFALECEYKFFNVDLFTQLGKSSLIDPDQSVALESEGAAEYATEWVPARNLVMLSIATAIAEAQGFDTIMFGGNLEESGTHPDNEIELVHGFNYLLPNAVQAGRCITLKAPLANLMKGEIVKLGVELDAPLKYSWTCYTQGPTPCGECGACYTRAKGFEMAGHVDPILTDPDTKAAALYFNRSQNVLKQVQEVLNFVSTDLRSSTTKHCKSMVTPELIQSVSTLIKTKE